MQHGDDYDRQRYRPPVLAPQGLDRRRRGFVG
jgi:hypothetical protein